jgi:hypothetical protein
MQYDTRKGTERMDVRIVDGVARMCMAKKKEFGFTTRVNGPHAVPRLRALALEKRHPMCKAEDLNLIRELNFSESAAGERNKVTWAMTMVSTAYL